MLPEIITGTFVASVASWAAVRMIRDYRRQELVVRLPANRQAWAAQHGLELRDLRDPAVHALAMATIEAVVPERIDSFDCVLVGRVPAGRLTLVQHLDRRFQRRDRWGILVVGDAIPSLVASLETDAQVPLLRWSQETPAPLSLPARRLHEALASAVRDLPGAVVQLAAGRVSLVVGGFGTPRVMSQVRDAILKIDEQLPRIPGRGLDGLALADARARRP